MPCMEAHVCLFMGQNLVRIGWSDIVPVLLLSLVVMYIDLKIEKLVTQCKALEVLLKNICVS